MDAMICDAVTDTASHSTAVRQLHSCPALIDPCRLAFAAPAQAKVSHFAATRQSTPSRTAPPSTCLVHSSPGRPWPLHADSSSPANPSIPTRADLPTRFFPSRSDNPWHRFPGPPRHVYPGAHRPDSTNPLTPARPDRSARTMPTRRDYPTLALCVPSRSDISSPASSARLTLPMSGQIDIPRHGCSSPADKPSPCLPSATRQPEAPPRHAPATRHVTPELSSSGRTPFPGSQVFTGLRAQLDPRGALCD